MTQQQARPEREPRPMLDRLWRHFGLVLLLAVVLLAAYVSVGRQFMPAIAGYSGFFENQIHAITGVPVQVESLSGGFSGFNPVIEVNGLSMQVTPGAGSPEAPGRALEFDRGRVVVNMARSILQRRWVLEEFVVERLELELAQTSDGGWLLGDIAMPAGAGIDPDTLYRAFLDVAQLDLRDVLLTVRTRTGEALRFIDGAARIQNRNGNHFLHVDIFPEGQGRPLALSLEVRGGNLSVIDGSLHLAVPQADYSYLFSDQERIGFSLETFNGGGDVWVDFSDGEPSRIVSTVTMEELALSGGNGGLTALNSLSGAVKIRREGDTTHYALADMAFDYQGESWQPANLYLAHQPETSLTVRADRADLAMLGELAASLDWLPDTARNALEQLRPFGTLENISLHAPLGRNGGELRVRANVDRGAIASLGNAPAMSGLDGYLEVTADLGARRASGRVEIDAADFTINIPSVYNDTWAYDQMNGRVNFELDYSQGTALRIGSSVLAGSGSGVESRVRFHSRLDQPRGEERESELDLLVGVLQMDAAASAPFLPDGPSVRGGLRGGMEFLEEAIAGGSLHNSGGIFRGITTQGSDRLGKTFQSFFQWRDGMLRFGPQWPELHSRRALVHSNDSEIEIFMEEGSSRGLEAPVIRGELQTDDSGVSLLAVSGEGSATAADGLAWLQAIPAAPGLRGALAGWRASGELQGGFDVLMPLGGAEAETDIRLSLDLSGGELWVSQYELDLSGVDGELVFDTRTGIEKGEFTAEMFGGDAGIELSSRGEAGEIGRIAVVARGRAERRDLLQWPRQSGLVKGLLENARGSFLYAAELYLDQGAGGAASLRLASDLAGLFLDLPEPFSKQAGEALPLFLQIDQLGGEQRMVGALGGELRFDLSLAEAGIRQGWLRLGNAGGRRVEAEASSGLMVTGSLERLALEDWTGLLADITAASPASGSFHGDFAWLELDVGEVGVYGQQLEAVAIRMDPISSGFRVDLSGASVQGSVEIPLTADDYLRAHFDYLRFKGEDAPLARTEASEVAEPEPRVDLLARIDPRRLPRMQFSAGEIRIGETPWGRWRFTLEPDAAGAEFTDLGFDFRGLRTAPAPEVNRGEDPAQTPGPWLRWRYDGEDHATELAAELIADDIAAVLLDSGYAASLESESARFATDLQWPGSPAFFHGPDLSGNIGMRLENGRFLETTAGGGTLKLISIINFDAIMRRLRLSDDLLRRGLAFDEITGRLNMENGLAQIEDELMISGPSSLYQITGAVNLRDETIAGELSVTLPVSDNIPWIGLITGNLPLAVGAYLFDRIFGDQVDSLTSAVYILEGPWEGLEPEFKQAFGTPGND